MGNIKEFENKFDELRKRIFNESSFEFEKISLPKFTEKHQENEVNDEEFN
jgi:hypothetical protein